MAKPLIDLTKLLAGRNLGRNADDLIRGAQNFMQGAAKGGPRVTTGSVGAPRAGRAAVTSATDGASMGRVPITGDPSLVNRARNNINITPGDVLKAAGLGAGGALAYGALDRYVFGGNLPGGMTPEQVSSARSGSGSDDGGGTSTPGDTPEPSYSGDQPQRSAWDQPQIFSAEAIQQLLANEQENRRWRQEETKRLSSDEYLDAVAARNIAQQAAINKPFLESMERRTMENSRRQESVARINAWKEVEKQTILANTSIAQSLATIAYQAGTPNANVLKATSPALTAGAASFRPGQSVI